MNINRNHIIKIFPKYSKILNLINNVPLFFEYIKQNESMNVVCIQYTIILNHCGQVSQINTLTYVTKN